MLPTMKTSHSVGTTGRILRNKLTKHMSQAKWQTFTCAVTSSNKQELS